MATGRSRADRKSEAARKADVELRKKYADPNKVVEPLGEVKRQVKVAEYTLRPTKRGDKR